ncbi:hypothetical protein GCM10009779_65950 [Polymorphospora rubra]|uniref:Uncharacterized protein n=1 Tax=Polymorphospora rubra TaxID=338584 RepID=A0A810MXZ1_9ACTN|nr:hypothetical protein Prubr_18600 [Polymorphospora rubra]
MSAYGALAAAVALFADFGVQHGCVGAALVPPSVQVCEVRLQGLAASVGRLGEQSLGGGGVGVAAYGLAVQAEGVGDGRAYAFDLYRSISMSPCGSLTHTTTNPAPLRRVAAACPPTVGLSGQSGVPAGLDWIGMCPPVARSWRRLAARYAS